MPIGVRTLSGRRRGVQGARRRAGGPQGRYHRTCPKTRTRGATAGTMVPAGGGALPRRRQVPSYLPGRRRRAHDAGPALASASFPESRGAARPRWRRLAAGAAGCPVPPAKGGSTGRRIPRHANRNRGRAGVRSEPPRRSGRYDGTCRREDQSRDQNLYAPPWWVGLFAQMDMMAAMLLKPRRFVEGTSGCMRRGDRGPLVAACRTRLLRSEKGCPSRGLRRSRWAWRARGCRCVRRGRRASTCGCRRGCRTRGRGPSSRRRR